MTSHPKDMRQDRERANEEAARRPGVDADNALDERGHMTATPHKGSTYQPLRRGSDEDRQRAGDSDYVIDQGAGSAASGHHGVSRGGAVTQHGDSIRETQSSPGGGSVFQPLEDDARNLEDREALQRGNPAGQNQQGLNEGSRTGRRSGAEMRGAEGEARGHAPDPGRRRP